MGPTPGPSTHIDDYLRSEVLERRSTAEITFLTRTSILGHLSAPLCDVVAGRHGSAEILRQLASSTLLLDDYGGSFRYHTLLRDFLQRELAVREPAQVTSPPPACRRVVRRRTMPSSALSTTPSRRATPRSSPRWSATASPSFTGPATARRSEHGPGVWASEALEARPWLAVLAAWEEIAAGDVAATMRFADVAERGVFEGSPPDGTSSFEAGRAMLRAGNGSPWGGRRAGERHESGRARRGPWLVAGLRAMAAGLRAPHDRRCGGRRRSPCRRSRRGQIVGPPRAQVLRARTPRSRGRRTGGLGCRGCPDRGERYDRAGIHRSMATYRASRRARSASSC